MINNKMVEGSNIESTLKRLVETMITNFKSARTSLENKQEVKSNVSEQPEAPIDEDFVEHVKM
jgi:hypothetical protein